MQPTDWSHIKAIIFDMDGTLVDTEGIWKRAEQALLAGYDRQYDPVVHAPFLGLATDELIARIRQVYRLEHVDQKTLEDDLHNRLQRQLRSETIAREGAVALVASVLDNEIPCAIASNSSMEIIAATLENQPWTHRIPIWCSADHVPQGKPAPDLYLFAAQRLGVDAGNCLAIEDSLNGVIASTAAGMISLAVPEIEHSVISTLESMTPYTFHGLNQVREFLVENKILRG